MRTCTRFFDLKRDLVNYRGAKHQSEMGVYTRDDNGKVHEDGKKLIKRVTHLKNMFILKVCTLPITALFVAIGALFEKMGSNKTISPEISLDQGTTEKQQRALEYVDMAADDGGEITVFTIEDEDTKKDGVTKSCFSKFIKSVIEAFSGTSPTGFSAGLMYQEEI